MGIYQESRMLLNTIINVIVGVSRTGDITDLLRMYEEVCLRPGLKTQLHVVLCGRNENMLSKVSLLQRSYPRKNITIHQVSTENFSHATSYDHVANKLRDTDLMLFFDYNFVFTAEFLDHCRINAVRGRQAYFPVLFSFYKPELVHRHIQRPLQMLISADTGFFLRYNYQVVAIYKSDYKHVGGFGRNPLTKGSSAFTFCMTMSSSSLTPPFSENCKCLLALETCISSRGSCPGATAPITPPTL